MAFLPPMAPGDCHVVAQRSGLTVEVVSPRILLAMKMAAFRTTDVSDLVVLFDELEIERPDEAVRITREAYGTDAVDVRDDADDELRLQAEEVLERLRRGRTEP